MMYGMWYASWVQCSITQFRRDLFSLADAAREGEQVSFLYKGVQFRVVPASTGNRLDRLTPLEVLNPTSSDEEAAGSLTREMVSGWEEDWSAL